MKKIQKNNNQRTKKAGRNMGKERKGNKENSWEKYPQDPCLNDVAVLISLLTKALNKRSLLEPQLLYFPVVVSRKIYVMKAREALELHHQWFSFQYQQSIWHVMKYRLLSLINVYWVCCSDSNSSEMYIVLYYHVTLVISHRSHSSQISTAMRKMDTNGWRKYIIT